MLLADEPLGALDLKLRRQIGVYPDRKELSWMGAVEVYLRPRAKVTVAADASAAVFILHVQSWRTSRSRT